MAFIEILLQNVTSVCSKFPDMCLGIASRLGYFEADQEIVSGIKVGWHDGLLPIADQLWSSG